MTLNVIEGGRNDLAPYADELGKPHITPRPEPKYRCVAATLLEEAADLVDGERALQHGDKFALHKTMAALFSAYLDVPIAPHQAAMVEALLKVARTKYGTFNRDDFRDGAGYLGIAGELAEGGC